MREGVMRFVIVNDRLPPANTLCTLCCEAVTASYLREIGTGLIYCDHRCYGQHVKMATSANEDHAQRAG
jgi:hypothetical protein